MECQIVLSDKMQSTVLEIIEVCFKQQLKDTLVRIIVYLYSRYE
jgi:hypothetical protein